ncbi:MAG: hypothetical protein Kow0059_08880 [Candidatus Sumerlaeia bacterium]
MIRENAFPYRRACVLACALGLVLVWGWTGCARPEPLGRTTTGPAIQFTGVVTWVEQDDGFWGIVRDGSGARYLPINLPLEFQRSGLRVRVRCRPVRHTSGAGQWGRQVWIDSVERAGPSPPAEPPH